MGWQVCSIIISITRRYDITDAKLYKNKLYYDLNIKLYNYIPKILLCKIIFSLEGLFEYVRYNLFTTCPV